MNKLPVVPSADELIDIAFHRARNAPSRVMAPMGKQRSISISKVECVSDYLTDRLEMVIDGYSRLDVSPFAREMLSIELNQQPADENPLEPQIRRISGCILIIRKLRNTHISRIARSPPSASLRIREAFYGRITSLIKDIERDLSTLQKARNLFLRLPEIKDSPVVVIAGFPNAGKSSLLNRISSGRAKVAPYPFTTKYIYVGHAKLGRLDVQFVDTPGLLDRNDDRRNEIESRAIAAIRHLPDLILFLIDPTGVSGSIDEQVHLLTSIKTIFREKEVLPVFTKCDLLETRVNHPEVRIHISSKTGEGIQPLLALIEKKLLIKGT
jgi:nucleolar GTP-binding protein